MKAAARPVVHLGVLATALLGALPAAAESTYNCKRGIVALGDAAVTVHDRCGEPAARQPTAGGGAEESEEDWFYGGGNKIVYRLHFRGGLLKTIDRERR